MEIQTDVAKDHALLYGGKEGEQQVHLRLRAVDLGDGEGALAFVMVNDSGDPVGTGLTDAELRASAVVVSTERDSVTAKSVTTDNAGDKVIVSPSSGKKIRLYWYSMAANPGNAGHNVVGFKFGTNDEFVSVPLSQYGAAFAHSFRAGESYVEGAADEDLIMTLSDAYEITANVDYEEVD